MPLVEGMVFEENEFNDFTLRLENYISKIITATMSLGGRKITNIIYETKDGDMKDTMKVYSIIKKHVEDGDYLLVKGDDFFELKINPEIYDTLKNLRQEMVVETDFEKYNELINAYNHLGDGLVKDEAVERELLELKNRAFNYHTRHNFYPKNF